MNVYDRQKQLTLFLPASVAVVGVGGVGSWVALDLALTGVRKIVAIDHDVVEESNLNRTPYAVRHIGQPKVQALTELILERRPDCDVIPICKRVEELSPFELKLFTTSVAVDCRDVTAPLPHELGEQWIKIGYDGFEITIHLNPQLDSVWGDGPVTYSTVPSWLVPPQLAAALITTEICARRCVTGEVIKTIDVRDIMSCIIESCIIEE